MSCHFDAKTEGGGGGGGGTPIRSEVRDGHLSPHSLSCTQLIRTFRSKRPAVNLSISCVLFKNLLLVESSTQL